MSDKLKVHPHRLPASAWPKAMTRAAADFVCSSPVTCHSSLPLLTFVFLLGLFLLISLISAGFFLSAFLIRLTLTNDLRLGRSGFSGFRGLLFFRSRRHHVSHDAVGVSENLDLGADGQLGHAQALAQCQWRHVNIDGLRNVIRKTLNFHLAQHEFKNSTLDLHTLRLAGDMDRH